MENKETLQKNITTTFGELVNILSAFKDNQIDIIPFEGSWTAGQVAEHITKAVSGTPQLFNGATELTTRQPDEKIRDIENIFLDFKLKLKSPEFIEPKATQHDKNSLIKTLKKIEEEFIALVETHDLTLICKDFELPTFGTLTKYEWINFSLIHIQRHTYQLKNIQKLVIK